jgi:HD-GYP domain-containing protein (c-di-GMP phosphodiesterase class II)
MRAKRFSRESFLEETPHAARVKKIIDGIPGAISVKTQREAIQVMKSTLQSVRVKGLLDSAPVKTVVRKMVRDIITNRNATVKLIDIKTFDEYTFTHSINVSILSLLIGLELKLNRIELEELGLGAILHDVGKITIPLQVLRKPGKLTEDEFAMIKDHPIQGYQILSKDKAIGEIPKLIALQHHERFKGSGYPKGLSGSEINDFAVITGLSDVYDALTTDRPYRKKFSPYEAIRIIVCSCPFDFNPKIGKLFVQKMTIYPMGSLVKLNTGETGIVVRTNKDAILRPVIRVILDAYGQAMDSVVEIDLAKRSNQFIVGPVDDRMLSEV